MASKTSGSKKHNKYNERKRFLCLYFAFFIAFLFALSVVFIGIKSYFEISSKENHNGRVDLSKPNNIVCQELRGEKIINVPCKYEYITDKNKKIFDTFFNSMMMFMGVFITWLTSALTKFSGVKGDKSGVDNKDREELVCPCEEKCQS